MTLKQHNKTFYKTVKDLRKENLTFQQIKDVLKISLEKAIFDEAMIHIKKGVSEYQIALNLGLNYNSLQKITSKYLEKN